MAGVFLNTTPTIGEVSLYLNLVIHEFIGSRRPGIRNVDQEV